MKQFELANELSKVNLQQVEGNPQLYIDKFLQLATQVAITRDSAIKATSFYIQKLQQKIIDTTQRKQCFMVQQYLLSQFNLSNINKNFVDFKLNQLSPQQVAILACYYSNNGPILSRLKNTQIALIFDPINSINKIFHILIFCGRLDLIQKQNQYLNDINQKIFCYINEGNIEQLKSFISENIQILGNEDILFFIQRSILLAELNQNCEQAQLSASSVLIDYQHFNLLEGVPLQQINFDNLQAIGDQSVINIINEKQ